MQECLACSVPAVEMPLYPIPEEGKTSLYCFCCVEILHPAEAQKIQAQSMGQIICDKNNNEL